MRKYMDDTRLKLCYVLPKYDANTEEHFLHTYDFLQKLGEKVDLFLVIEKSIGCPYFEGIQNVYRQRFTQRFLRFTEALLIILKVRLAGYKHFYTHYSYYGGIASSIVTKVLGGKSFYWNCGLAKQYFVRWKLNRKSLVQKFTIELPMLLTLRLSNFLVTGSLKMARYYSENFRVPLKKILVIPNDINLNRFSRHFYNGKETREKLGVLDKTKIVLFVHRLSGRKGAQYIATIADLVRSRIQDLVFLIIGGGPCEEMVKKELQERNLTSTVRMLGWIPNKDIPKYYAAADLLIVPSDEEGVPRVLLEAMAMGVPFVAFDVGGIRDICTDLQCGYLVEKGNVLGFANQILSILQNEQERQSLIIEGLTTVENYSSEKIRDLFIETVLIRKHG